MDAHARTALGQGRWHDILDGQCRGTQQQWIVNYASNNIEWVSVGGNRLVTCVTFVLN